MVTSIRARIARATVLFAIGVVSASSFVHSQRSSRLFILQCLSALSVLIGVSSIWGWPVALIVGGIGGVLAVEFQPKSADAKTGSLLRSLIAEANRRGAQTINVKGLSDLVEK